MKIKRKFFANITNTGGLNNEKQSINNQVAIATASSNRQIAKTSKAAADGMRDVTGDSINTYVNPNKTEGTKVVSYRRPVRRKSKALDTQLNLEFESGKGDFKSPHSPKPPVKNPLPRAIKTTPNYTGNTVKDILRSNGSINRKQYPLAIPGFWYKSKP